MRHYRPQNIPALSLPVTTHNRRNSHNHPGIELGACTPSQAFNNMGIDTSGTVCVIGNPAKGVDIAQALIRRNTKPFLLIGPATDSNSVFSALNPQWTQSSATENLPSGNGAIFFTKPSSSYLEICEYFEDWSATHFVILHLSGGIQAGVELLNLINATEQCLVFCDSVPQGLRHSESKSITAGEFMMLFNYLVVFNSGVATKDLIEILPTYQYENVSNVTNFNTFNSRNPLNLFHKHRGMGISIGQNRTIEFKKSIYEMDELQRIFNSGTSLLFNAKTNTVYLAHFI